MKTLITLLMLASTAAVAAPRAKVPAYNCESVRKNALEDLRGFCESSEVDKRRLVDYGFQMDVLEGQCSDAETAGLIKAALNAKVIRQDERSCLNVADSARH
jgi:hypothetical protein